MKRHVESGLVFKGTRRAAQGILTALCVASVMPSVAGTLENDAIRAEFNATGLAGITDKASSKSVRLASDHFAAFAGNESIESDFLSATLEQESATNRVYRFESGPWAARVVYELQPGWAFISKQVLLAHSGKAGVRVQRLEMWRGQVETPIAGQQRIRDGTLLRFADGAGREPTHGMFLALQNPFLQLKRQEQRLSAAYPPDVMWNPTNGVYASDRLLFGPYAMSGMRSPARMVPEWRFVADAQRADDAWLDAAEVDALVECVRSFLLYKPKLPVRVMIGWTVNDYQIDIATPEGRTEYKRIIDQAAAVGAQHLLFDPANSVEAPLSENRDAWGWENLLWFTMGQKVRKGEWDPATDKLPASVQELVDHARVKDLRFLAYVYPSLPFLQQKEWTSWVPNGRPGGYLGADTGQRSFQDWLVGKLVDFHRTTGASGFSFDHWWIAYEETDSSKYAQWDGCRRILDQLRLQIPDVVLDGRQQYHHFGSWTWLAGTYPHPLMSDEQPESFPAFPDLHWSRVSADRQRRTAWYFRHECFTPVEIIPGYMTHQTPRLTETGECPRDRFRPADWDLLGWKYSVISSIATAPFNHVINFLPARDEREFKAFSAGDQQWFRDWLDWTDQNIDILREVKPILGAPQLGRVDGTAAFKDGRGFVFLFNPNYRQLPAEFTLDKSIGLTTGDRFIVRQLYPDPERGRLLAPRGKAFWNSGDTVSLGMAGTEAVVLEVSPAPATVDQPLLLGAVGKAALNNGRLELSGVRSEMGGQRAISVVLPSDRTATSATVNGSRVEFRQAGALVSLAPKFGGAPFSARAQIGRYDPGFAGSSYRAEATIPSRVFAQLEGRKRSWPVEYTEEERAAVWLNSDRLILFINIAEPDYQNTNGVTLKVNGEPVPVKPAYTSIVRSNPRHTFVGWYADVSSLKPDVKHTFEVELPKLARGQFQGLFFDTVEEEYTDEVTLPDMIRPLWMASLAVAVAVCAGAAERLVPAPEPSPWRLWQSMPPEGCPFPQSTTLAGVAFSGRHAEYTGADTWYPSWAADGNLYAPWTDGNVNGLGCNSAGEGAATGHATILGDDPLKLIVTNQGVFKSSPRPYEGRYPCGSLVHNGVWYYGTYCLHPGGGIRREDGILYNWPWLGPFVGFRWSTDFGKTWTETPCTPEKPLFGEHALKGEPVKIGAPHFVDLGRELEHSPDGKAYLVAQGASDGKDRRFAYNSWITADQAYLIRVMPGIENMNDASKYEFFAGHNPEGAAVWTKDFAQIKPIAEWRDHMGCVTMTYNAALRKFLLCVTDGGNTVSRYSTYILESDRITGPWRMVSFMKNFGEQAYFVNVPSKFIAPEGRDLWLCYSANFSSGWGGTTFQSRPPGSRYAMCLQELRLLAPSEIQQASSQLGNIARDATITVSTTHPDYSSAGATDGVVGGYPGDIQREWASHGEHDTALLRLTWSVPKTIDRVVLFDRPNDLDQITSGMLVFSDGSTLVTGALPDDAKQGLEVTFPPKTVKWLVFLVTGAKPGSPNIGLSEIAVFEASPQPATQ